MHGEKIVPSSSVRIGQVVITGCVQYLLRSKINSVLIVFSCILATTLRAMYCMVVDKNEVSLHEKKT